MSNFWSIFILKIFLYNFVLTSPTTEIDCIFQSPEDEFIPIGIIPWCKVSPSTTITEPSTIITSLNMKAKSQDVQGFVVRDGLFNYFPRNIEKFLNNLTAIMIRSSSLKQIDREELAPFNNLKYLELSYNNLTILDKNLFIHNPELLGLYLQGNQIFHVDSMTFNGLEKITHFNFNENNSEKCRLTKMLYTENHTKVVGGLNKVVRRCFNMSFVMDQDKRIGNEVLILKNNIKDLNLNLSNAEDEIKILKSEIVDLNGKILEFSTDIGKLQNLLNEKIQKIDEINQNLTDKIEAIENLQNDQKLKDEKISNLTQNLNDLKSQKSETLQEKIDVEKLNQELEKKIQNLQQEKSENLKIIEKYETQVQNLNQTVEENLQTLSNLEDQKSNLESQISNLKTVKIQNEEKISEVKSENFKNQLKITNLTSQVDFLQIERNSLETLITNQKLNESKILEKNQDCEAKNLNLTNQISTCSTNAEKLTNDVNNCESKLDDEKLKLSTLKNEFNDLNAKFENTKNSHSNLTSENSNLKSVIDILDQEIKNLKNSLQSQKNNFTSQLENCRQNSSEIYHQIVFFNRTNEDKINSLKLINDEKSSDVKESNVKFYGALGVVGFLCLLNIATMMSMYCKKRSYSLYKTNLIKGPRYNNMSVDGLDEVGRNQERNAGNSNSAYDDGQVGEIMEVDSSMGGLSEKVATSKF